jgi:8-oxo-dGTP pyrophosphatase MutT (NUDIX family)
MKSSNPKTELNQNLSMSFNQKNKKIGLNEIMRSKFPSAFDSNKRRRQPRGNIYGAIIRSINTNKYLMVKGRESGKYSFPKGHIEPYESPIECVLRELYEETGISYTPKIEMKEVIKSRIGSYVYCESPDEIPVNIIDSKEIEEAGWYSEKDIESMILNADASYYLRQNGIRGK